MTHIAALRLTDFRSYAALDMDLLRGPVVLFGANGAGKTNILEAISLLSPGRGLRRAGLGEIVRSVDGVPAPAWGINATLADDTRLSVGQVPDQPRRRLLRINGTAATGAQLAAQAAIMWLTPAQDRLFTGPESDRRRFIDRFALSYAPAHGVAALRYEKARSERNRLLSDGVMDAAWYDALESDMASQAAEIARSRVETIGRLQIAIAARESIFPKADIHLDGLIENWIEDGMARDDAEFAFREALERDRPRDRAAGRTLSGPHKTEIKVHHITKSMPAALCSTGEQKALLLNLMLAHMRAFTARQAERGAPILLLDEVAAHLDQERRDALAQELIDLGAQCFLTGTDRNLFQGFGDAAQYFRVSESQVKEE